MLFKILAKQSLPLITNFFLCVALHRSPRFIDLLLIKRNPHHGGARLMLKIKGAYFTGAFGGAVVS